MTAAPRPIALHVEGMHCAACVARVEKVLARVPGVETASVNFATGSARVVAAEGTDPAALIHAVERAGYGARVSRAGERAEAEKRAAEALAETRRGAILAGVVAVPAVLMMVPGVVPHAWMRPAEIALWVLCIPVLLGPGRVFFVRAWRSAMRRQLDMDALVALGTGAASVHGLGVLGGLLPGHAYLDAIPVVIAMVLAGRVVEGRARRATGDALRALLDLAPAEAVLVTEEGEQVLPLASVRPGATVIVRAGARVPVDGVVEEGNSAVDQAMLTGEPVPVEVGPGSAVLGGTVNGPGRLRVRATAVGEDAAVGRIARALEDAQAQRPPIAALVDRIAGIFVPIVLALAIVAALAWSLFDPLRGIEAGLAVLVVACPCAMGLATPISLALGLGKLAQAGVLVRSGGALQALAEVDTVVFDKTGTLTAGSPVVVHVDGQVASLRLAAAASLGTGHPLSGALVRAVDAELPTATEVVAHPGLGAEALVEGHRVRVGSPRWLGPVQGDHGTPIVVEIDGARAAVAFARDVARPGAAAAVAAMRARGLRTVLLTGDTRDEASRVAQELGLDEVHAEVLPADKAGVIARLRDAGRKVAMVGDGINDAPALAAAHVGVAMGSGTDVAIEAADVALQASDLGALVAAIDTARGTLRNVQQNLVAAFGYNVLVIPVAMLGLLQPALAGAAMALSSVTVVTNARRVGSLGPGR